ncbi:uncharacterized protein LOC132724769 [Ruditapes philippinarum]|uniref:uncharacterized protein LOC132724769 n=1 Tax=Ruditapes philippinarum TaxID=129788 RepID=UPI00295A73EB|nr:uncharacterized protein LOC132724769 [Ruditapes philippinarum]
MDVRDYIIYSESAVLVIGIIVVIIESIRQCLRRRKVRSHDLERNCHERCAHINRFNEAESEWKTAKTILQNKLKLEENEKKDFLKRFKNAEEEWKRQMLGLHNELTKEKEIKDDALKMFKDAETEWNRQVLSLHDELTKEKKVKENALKRITETEAEWRNKVSILQDELRKEALEKDDALKRLSAIMANRLKDGNPNVVDLSDQNRPGKLGEQFTELYDNQWTDAYGAIDDFFGKAKSEPEIIKILVEIFEKCFTECKALSGNQMDQLNDNVSCIASIITKKDNNLPTDLMQRIKEERKAFAVDEVPDLTVILPTLKTSFSSKNQEVGLLDEQHLIVYIKECLKLSWLMVIQDPPMAIVLKPETDTYENFKAYKTRGKFLKYIVWPALLLMEGGPLVTKGVAEFTSET